jgi:hypothetical protein
MSSQELSGEYQAMLSHESPNFFTIARSIESAMRREAVMEGEVTIDMRKWVVE